MPKRILTAALVGGLTLIAWTFVVNGLLGFRARIDMRQLPAEEQVYEVLRQHVVEPGRYTVNPALTAEGRFPMGQPVFSVSYGGMGHEAAGRLMLLGWVYFLGGPLIAAWMLSQGSDRLLSSYPRKVLFVAAVGLLLALLGDLSGYGIGGYPLRDALLLAANDLASWTVLGLVLASWITPPDRPAASGPERAAAVP